MEIDQLLNAFATLFVTIDPISTAPLFLVLTTGENRRSRLQIALRGIVIAAVILILFAIAGIQILDLFGITLPAFRIAGGLLLFSLAFEMVYERRQKRHQDSATRALDQQDIKHIAIFPLAIPLIAGPGAISATVLLSTTMAEPIERITLIGVILAVMLLCMIVFALAERVDRFLGKTSRMVLTRLFGVLLAALSVQFVVDGVKEVITATGL